MAMANGIGGALAEVVITAAPDIIKAVLGWFASRGNVDQVNQILARYPEFEACDDLVIGRAENAKREAAARLTGQTPA
jgi:hypothetical protein